MGKDNFDKILSNKRASYNKEGLGYQPDNNTKYFMSIYHAKKKKFVLFINAIIVINLGTTFSLIILVKFMV